MTFDAQELEQSLAQNDFFLFLGENRSQLWIMSKKIFLKGTLQQTLLMSIPGPGGVWLHRKREEH